MTGLEKRTHIHTDKQQLSDDSHIHLCNIKTCAHDTRTVRVPYFYSARDYNRQINKKKERQGKRQTHTLSHHTSYTELQEEGFRASV